MSSAFFKLKLLNKNRRKKSRTKTVQNSKEKNITDMEPPTDNNKCRICLNDGFIPIYGDEATFNLPDAIRAIGGVEVNKNDEFPTNMCSDCYSLLKGAVLFRKSAQESDEILHKRFKEKISSPIISDEENHADDFNMFEEPKVANEYKCQTCNLQFDSLVKLRTHKNSKKHNKHVFIQCQMCHKLLTSHLYEKHLRRHRSSSHLVCDICGKLYRKDNLIRHLQLHSNELPFQCQLCPYRGRFMESLKIHMRTHSGDKPFSCDKCELRFITKSNLNRHSMTHKKDKPFNCVECTRGFYTKRDLDAHLKADHAGNKEFGCRLCGNKYGTKKALMRHELRVHKREKMAKGRMPLYMQVQFQNNN